MVDQSGIAVTAGQMERPLTRALRLAVADVKGIAGLLLALVGMIGAYVGLRDAIHLPPPWPIIGCVVPVPIFFLFYVLPAWRDAIADRRLHELGIRGRLKEPGYFRLTPYEAHEREKFVRPDSVDVRVARWIKESSSSVLYLSGQSGVGKSSLLGASVLPELSRSGWKVIPVRPHDDPLGAIKRAVLEADQEGQTNPDTSSALDVIDRSVDLARQQDQHVLIAVDQFEEALILLQEEVSREPLIKLFQELVSNPRRSLTILLSLRSEYLSDLESLSLPPPTLGRNCLEVRPFSHADAQDFLERSRIDVGASLMKEIFAEVSEIEDMPDRVRPVVLNMIGLVLASFRGALPKGVRPGRLLSGYVHRAISATDVRLHAANLLRPLVTNVGTKRSLPLASIASEAQVTPAVARGCLLRLADSGLVRAIDQTSERWEIAHDFVARLVQPIVQHWTRSFWEVARKWVAPGALSLWIIVVLAGAFLYPNWQDEQIRKELDAAGIVPAPSSKGGELAFQYNGQDVDEATFRQAIGLLLKLRGTVAKLDIGSAKQLSSLKGIFLPSTLSSLALGGPLANMEGFPNLPSLKSLTVRGYNFKSLAGLPNLPNLERLDLQYTNLEDLVSLPPCASLHHLSVKSVGQKLSLVGMPILPSLETLELDGNVLNFRGMPTFSTLRKLKVKDNSLTSLSDLPRLPALTRLQLQANRLPNLAHMPVLPALKTLVLGDSFNFSLDSDPNVEISLEGMPILPALQILRIENSKLLNLKGMVPLPALKLLRLEGLSDFESLSSLPVLASLERLELVDLPKFKSFAGMEVQPALKKLTLGSMSFISKTNGLETLSGMPRLPVLETLELGDLPRLTTLADMPIFPAIEELSINSLPLTNFAGMPSLPTLARLTILNSSVNTRRGQPDGVPKIKSLVDLPPLPNLKVITLGDDLLGTIPDRIRLEKVITFGEVKTLYSLARFKATLHDLTVYSNDAADWNSIAALSNLEKLEVGYGALRSHEVILALPNLKSLKLMGEGELDLESLNGSKRDLEVVLTETNRKIVKLPSSDKVRVTWEASTQRDNDDDD